ncbi:MAG: PepSY domain-containing protein [Prevotella sp.]|nr:PepSY domain-containing protein [Prevotella sp.]
MLKNILYSIHRILGTILSILFLVWFLSGFVMIYHTFPKATERDKNKHMYPLQGDMLALDSILANNIPKDEEISALSLKSYAGTPFFEVKTSDSIYRIPASPDMELKTPPDYQEIKAYAQRWCQAEIVRVDTLRELEQWIPFGPLRKDFPIYKFYFGDEGKSQLYVSSVSGDALQFTDKDSRFWAWLGAIPHWVYFTSLRQNSQQWMDVVIWLSGIGSVMCIAGLILGIRSYIKEYRRKKKMKSPYRKFAYKWHHILGFMFGIFVFTFVFSGMMSLAKVPGWMVKVHDPSAEKRLYSKQKIESDTYTLDYRLLYEKYHGQIKSVEWSSFGQKPIYKAVIDDRLHTIDASGTSVLAMQLDEAAIKSRISLLHKEPAVISLMDEYDNYYVGLTDHLPLPVYKVQVEDADNSTYYINPKNGNTRYFNNNTKVRRWSYQALHSFKFKFLAERPVLWNIVMWTTMIGGTLVSLTGVWLGFRYIKRKIKRLKKYICSKKKNNTNICQ